MAAISSANSLTTEGQPGPRPGSRAEGRSLGGPAHHLVPPHQSLLRCLAVPPPLTKLQHRDQVPGTLILQQVLSLLDHLFCGVRARGVRGWGSVGNSHLHHDASHIGQSGTIQPDPPGESRERLTLTWADRCLSRGAGEGGAQAKMGGAEWLTHSGGLPGRGRLGAVTSRQPCLPPPKHGFCQGRHEGSAWAWSG